MFNNPLPAINAKSRGITNAAVAQSAERILGKDEVHGFDSHQQLHVSGGRFS